MCMFSNWKNNRLFFKTSFLELTKISDYSSKISWTERALSFSLWYPLFILQLTSKNCMILLWKGFIEERCWDGLYTSNQCRTWQNILAAYHPRYRFHLATKYLVVALVLVRNFDKFHFEDMRVCIVHLCKMDLIALHILNWQCHLNESKRTWKENKTKRHKWIMTSTKKLRRNQNQIHDSRDIPLVSRAQRSTSEHLEERHHFSCKNSNN